MREFIDSAVFRDIILCANAALEQNKQLINELNAVSYTHLDVYKRQA